MISGNLLDQIAAILVEGEPCKHGCRTDEIEDIKLECMAIDPNKLWCIVSNWQIWKLKCSHNDATLIKEKYGLLPIKLYAENIIDDQQGRGWGCVRASLLKGIHCNCIFETANTFYILQNEGTQKTITPDQANAVIF